MPAAFFEDEDDDEDEEHNTAQFPSVAQQAKPFASNAGTYNRTIYEEAACDSDF
jgi:hypothetical protein